jgi:hypothetical protein
VREIAVIFATPPSVNPGMLLCEAMAKSFISRHNLSNATHYFRIVTLDDRLNGLPTDVSSQIKRDTDIGIKYEVFESQDQLQHMVPLYWGDFLHKNIYINTIAPLLRTGNDKDALARHLLLLEGSTSELLRRTISYATTLLYNTTSDYLDPTYGPAIARFLRGVHHVQLRDAFSAVIAADIRQSDISCFGIDAAQLLCDQTYEEALLGARLKESRRKRALVFFARGQHDGKQLRELLGEIASALEFSPVWFDWGDPISFPFLERNALELPVVALDSNVRAQRLTDLLSCLRESSLVVTDTYHLAVASWALGVPAIMVPGAPHEGELAISPLHHLSRPDKRRVAFLQDGLSDFIAESGVLKETALRAKFAYGVGRIISRAEYIRHIRDRIRGRVARSEQALVSALNEACQM